MLTLSFMEPIDVWAEFRDRLSRASKLAGWSQTKIAKIAKVPISTINSFLNRPSSGLNDETYTQLRPLIDNLIPPSNTLQSSAATMPRKEMLPMIDLDRIPWGSTDQDFPSAIEGLASGYASVPGADPSRDIVVKVVAPLRMRKTDFKNGDMVIIDRAAEVRPGCVALVSHGKRGGLADIEQEAGQVVAALASGERWKLFRALGVARYRMESLL